MIGGRGRPRKPEGERFQGRAKEKARTDEALDAAIAAKIVTGPWMTKIPEPDFVFNPVGKAKYDELAQLLFEKDRLTQITWMQVQVAAMTYQNVVGYSAAGKAPPAALMRDLQRALAILNVADQAKNISSPGKTNKFASSGFAHRKTFSVG